MNSYFVAAAVLTSLVALVHSVLGEVLIFSRMRRGRLVPTDGGSALLQRHVRILWASWHVLSVFAWAMAAMLLWMARQTLAPAALGSLAGLIAASMFGGAMLVLYATNGKHPGWIGMLSVAVLIWLGLAA